MTQFRPDPASSLGKNQSPLLQRVLVVGGSGFIGTDLVGSLLEEGTEVLSVDILPPRNPAHRPCFQKIDCLDRDSLMAVMQEFAPTQVVHLAARTDLDGHRIEDYAANTAGVCSLLEAPNQTPSVRRCLFTSTRLIRRTSDPGKHETDYAPHTLYGESKATGEELVRGKESCPVK